MLPKIAILVRDDFFSKKGGDTFQIKSYVDHSRKIDYHILCFDSLKGINHEDFALFVLTNVDCLSSYVRFSYWLASRDRLDDVVILPIHHSFSFSLPAVFSGHTSLALKYHIIREKLKTLVSSFVRFDIHSAPSIFALLASNYFKYIRKSFHSSRLIVCISEGEKNSILHDYSLNPSSVKFYIVRNGCDSQAPSLSGADESSSFLEDRDIDVLIVGRVENRKNQLNIVKAFEPYHLRVVFVGSLNPNNPIYCRKFLDAIRMSEYFSYHGPASMKEVVHLYRRSKVHLSASWFEVSSLVDIESYNQNCFVVSSSRGYSDEILSPPGFIVFSPNDLHLTAAKVDKLIRDGEYKKHQSFRKFYDYSWEQSSRALENLLLTLLESRF